MLKAKEATEKVDAWGGAWLKLILPKDRTK